MGSIGDNTSGGRYGYRMSKAAVNIAGVSLAHDLKPRPIASWQSLISRKQNRPMKMEALKLQMLN